MESVRQLFAQLIESSSENVAIIPAVAKSLRLKTDLVADRAASLNLIVPPNSKRAPHMIGIRFPGGIPQALPAKLLAEKIYVSVRGDFIRIAPHLYNTDTDFNRLSEVLEKMLIKED
jgi:selenocysteine lyase/cysteine desulfurase